MFFLHKFKQFATLIKRYNFTINKWQSNGS